MVTLIAPHPNALLRRYPQLQEYVAARVLRICDYHNWRGRLFKNEQVVLISPRAVMLTQVVTPSMRSDYSWLYTQLFTRTQHLAVLHALPQTGRLHH